MAKINTVLGKIDSENLGITLSHEHICGYCNFLYFMAGNSFLDMGELETVSIKFLKELKEKYNLSTFIDCTPVNLGRDTELLKRVSDKSGVNIVSSTGFYYTEEVAISPIDTDVLAKIVISDAKKTNAGIIKFAVEEKSMTALNKKMLSALCTAQKELSLPLCIHTNSALQNGKDVLDFILNQGIPASSITIAHLSDSNSLEYIKSIADKGCYIGMDRIYSGSDKTFCAQKAKMIYELSALGYQKQLLISHDALVFSGFETNPQIKKNQPFATIFDVLLPQLVSLGFKQCDIDSLLIQNPKNMLLGQSE